MNLVCTSSSGPSYFVPTFESSPDYRVSPLIGLVEQVREKVRGASLGFQAGIASLFGQFSQLSAPARVEEFSLPFAALSRLSFAPVNWADSTPAKPSEEQLRLAQESLLAMFLEGSVPAPHVMLLDDGTFGAFWRDENLYASVDFDLDGEYPWTVSDGDQISSGIWERGHPIPVALKERLNK